MESTIEWNKHYLPREYDLYLVTWYADLADRKCGPYVGLFEFVPEEDGEAINKWILPKHLREIGYRDVEVVAWSEIEPYK